MHAGGGVFQACTQIALVVDGADGGVARHAGQSGGDGHIGPACPGKACARSGGPHASSGRRCRSGSGCGSGYQPAGRPGGKVRHHNGNHHRRRAAQAGAAIAEAVVQLLDLTPINIAALLHVLDPGQLWVGLHHGVDGLVNAMLVDFFNVNLNALGGTDGQLTLGLQLGFHRCGLCLWRFATPSCFCYHIEQCLHVCDAYGNDLSNTFN